MIKWTFSDHDYQKVCCQKSQVNRNAQFFIWKPTKRVEYIFLILKILLRFFNTLHEIIIRKKDVLI